MPSLDAQLQMQLVVGADDSMIADAGSSVSSEGAL